MVYIHNKLRKEQIKTVPVAPPELEQEKISEPKQDSPALTPPSSLLSLGIEPIESIPI